MRSENIKSNSFQVRRALYIYCEKAMVKKSVLSVWVFAALFFASPHIAAESIESARAAYDDGRFLEAAELGEALNTSDALTLATASLVIYGFYVAEEEDRQPIFVRAMGLGEKAVNLDSSNALAHLRWGQAMGRYAQTISTMEALGEGYGKRIRDEFEAAIALDPDLPKAHTSLASWHWEAIEKAGILARATLGASNKTGAKHFERALELAPESKEVLFDYARGLLIKGKRKDRDKARETLVRAINIPSRNAYDGLLDEEAKRKLAELDE